MNRMTLSFDAKLENEAFARTSAVAFLMPLNPTVDEIMEIKTILAEAVVNLSLIHIFCSIRKTTSAPARS